MSTTETSSWRSCLAAASLLIVLQAGCTSALTTAYLRDGLWAAADHAESAPDGTPVDREDAPSGDAESGPVAPAPAVDRERREAALEEAMDRLSHLGALAPPVEAALVATLQRTQPEDWPVVVEEFVGSLAATAPQVTAATDEPLSAPDHRAEPAPTSTAAQTSTEEPVTDVAGEPAIASSADDMPPAVPAESPAPAAPPAPATVDPPVGPAIVPEPPLAVRSACFASAVRAWGDVDRFAADRFRPGQDVIVYVEIDNLSAVASPAGQTTCIDAVLRLVDDAGATLHTWTFDPVAETSPTRRRDYFARYVLHVPESIPTGSCRVEVDVIDARSGSTARTAIPLEIASAD